MFTSTLLASSAFTLAAVKLLPDPDTRFVILYAALVSLALFYFNMPEHVSAKRGRLGDPYGSFHLTLNGGSKNTPPKTEWLNMGYWKNQTTFPGACEALAIKVVEASHMKNDAVVLDVGHGSGESILTLLANPRIPRPSKIFGITSLLYHAQRTSRRVQDFQTSSGDSRTSVVIIHGDAVYNSAAHESTGQCGGDHPFSPSSLAETFDSILAIDCAYHFDTRHTFLSQAYQKLSPQGGRIALADVCFSANAQNSKVARLFACMTGVPRDNIVDIDRYKKRMEEIGYVDVEVEDITQDVFPNFFAFLRTQGLGWVLLVALMEKIASSGARYVVVGASRRQ
jgi:hypothetical protein